MKYRVLISHIGKLSSVMAEAPHPPAAGAAANIAAARDIMRQNLADGIGRHPQYPANPSGTKNSFLNFHFYFRKTHGRRHLTALFTAMAPLFAQTHRFLTK